MNAGTRPPVVWSIAGNDSGGGAGLGADQRMADAFGVHLCPVVAAVTAQHSQAVVQVAPVGVALLDAQLAALENDMPPQAVKTGLLASAEQVACVARWIDRLRERAPVALVVDPVLGASTGLSFADAAVERAYRELLLPRATVLTPNRREAARLLGVEDAAADELPGLARSLRRHGAQTVCITGGDAGGDGALALDWMSSPHASGWLAAPRIATPHQHGTGCSFATAAAAALARGFVSADALVLAKMATAHALEGGYAAGSGAGPVRARAGFAVERRRLPWLSWGEAPVFPALQRPASRADRRPLGLYAIVDSAERVAQVLAGGVRTVQLRIKHDAASASTTAGLRESVLRSVAACRAADAELFINDHWGLALECGAGGVHLGQQDLAALDDAQRIELVDSGLALGVSSHSLWELCRAATLAPRYVACGPVWPTTTKAMPWRAQGLDNLAWWCAMAPAPVVAIGGILDSALVHAAAASGADGVCVVRAVGADPARSLPDLLASHAAGRQEKTRRPVPALPHPTLDATAAAV